MPKLFLLTKKPAAPSLKRLQALLSTKLNYNVKTTRSATGPRGNVRKVFKYLNSPGIDKIRQFQAFTEAQVSCPDWTTDRAVAQGWIGDSHQVCVRKLTNSSQGKGLSIVGEGELPPAPLYTKYVKKKYEFRVHVFNGEVLRTTIKLKRSGVERTTTQIRNLENGYIFANVPDGVDRAVVELCEAEAIRAVAAVGYDYGAVDCVYNGHLNRVFILEVNSAPAMEGTTLEVYSNAIIESL